MHNNIQFTKKYRMNNKYVYIKYIIYCGFNEVKIYVNKRKNCNFESYACSYRTNITEDMYLYKLKIEKDFNECGEELKLKDLLTLNVLINNFIKSLSIYFGQ